MVGIERATQELIEAVGRRRTVVIAESGSDEEQYLEASGAEVNCGDLDNQHILRRPNPSKAALLEEFLHGTQSKLGLIASTADLYYSARTGTNPAALQLDLPTLKRLFLATYATRRTSATASGRPSPSTTAAARPWRTAATRSGTSSTCSSTHAVVRLTDRNAA